MNSECTIKTYLNEYIIESIGNIIIQYIQTIKGKHTNVFSGLENKTTQKLKLMEGRYIRFCMVDDYLHKISINDGHYTLSLFRIMIDNNIEKECKEYDRKMCKTYDDYPIKCVRVDDKMYIKYIHEHEIVCKNTIKVITKIIVSKNRNETYLLSADRNEIYVFDTFTGKYLRQFTLLVTKLNEKKLRSSSDISTLNFVNDQEAYWNNHTSMILSRDENEIIVSDNLNRRILSINSMTGDLLYEIMLEEYAKRPRSIALYNNEIFVVCNNDMYDKNSQYIMVYDKTTKEMLRQINTNISCYYITIAIFGDNIYIPHKKNVFAAAHYMVFDVNKKCENNNYEHIKCESNSYKHTKCESNNYEHIKCESNNYEHIKCESNNYEHNNCCEWEEYDNNFIESNDGLFGIYQGKAFLLGGTHQYAKLHIFK